MKVKFLFFIMFLFSINMQAQDDDVVAIDVLGDEFIIESPIDTLNFNSGKPQVFLIQIQSQNDGYTIAGNDIEHKELLKNFNHNQVKINYITKQSYIRLEDGQYIDVTDVNASYDAIVFWNGKSKSNLKTQEGSRLATEFVSEQLGQKKKSSYITNSELYKKEIAQLPKQDNFTEKSRKVMNRFLKNYSISEICTLNHHLFFNLNQDKVKTITVYQVNPKGKKTKYEQIHLNELNHPIKVIRFDDDGKTVYYATEFKYENDILKSIKHDEREDFIRYNDDVLFFTSDLGGANETTFYILKDNELLMKRILLMKDDVGFEEQNSFVEQRLEKGNINYYIDNELWTSTSKSAPNKFPFVLTVTSYDGENVVHKLREEVVKKSDSQYEIFYDNVLHVHKGKNNIQLNDRGLLETFTYKDENEMEKYQLEYTYY